MALQDFVRENIKRELTKQGLTQKALADKCGIHWVALNRILTGDAVPTLPTCEAIAKALAVPVQNFFQEPVDVT